MYEIELPMSIRCLCTQVHEYAGMSIYMCVCCSNEHKIVRWSLFSGIEMGYSRNTYAEKGLWLQPFHNLICALEYYCWWYFFHSLFPCSSSFFLCLLLRSVCAIRMFMWVMFLCFFHPNKILCLHSGDQHVWRKKFAVRPFETNLPRMLLCLFHFVIVK